MTNFCKYSFLFLDEALDHFWSFLWWVKNDTSPDSPLPLEWKFPFISYLFYIDGFPEGVLGLLHAPRVLPDLLQAAPLHGRHTRHHRGRGGEDRTGGRLDSLIRVQSGTGGCTREALKGRLKKGDCTREAVHGVLYKGDFKKEAVQGRLYMGYFTRETSKGDYTRETVQGRLYKKYNKT